jgi:hypothetical protein
MRYRFTTRTERRETGAWWHRDDERELVAPLSLDQVSGRLG